MMTSNAVSGGHRVSARGPGVGSISLILGPMFSGKTSELMRRLRRHLARKQSCLVLKYKKDTRYSLDDVISTHDRSELAAKPVEQLEEADNLVWAYDVVAIDEGQFMADITRFAEKWANEGKVVIIAALDGTFQRRPFATILELLPLAEAIDKLRAVCSGCGGDAAFTQRLTSEAQIEVVGGEDKYRAVCRACYNKALAEKAKQRRRQSIGVIRDRDLVDVSIGSPELPPLMRHLSLDPRQGTPTSSGSARTPFGEVLAGRGGRGTPGGSPATPTSRLQRRSSLSAVTIR